MLHAFHVQRRHQPTAFRRLATNGGQSPVRSHRCDGMCSFENVSLVGDLTYRVGRLRRDRSLVSCPVPGSGVFKRTQVTVIGRVDVSSESGCPREIEAFAVGTYFKIADTEAVIDDRLEESERRGARYCHREAA